MKIVIDLTSLYDHLSGIERYAKEIALAMLSREDAHEYVLVFKNEIDSDFVSFKDRTSVKMLVLKSHIGGGLGKLFFSQLVLPIRLYTIKADAYLFLAFPEPLLFCKRNIFSTIHDMAAFEMCDTLKWFSKWYFRLSYVHAGIFAKRIITVSRFSGNRINRILGRRRSTILVAHDGVVSKRSIKGLDSVTNEDTSLDRYQLPSRYMLSLSTIEPRKNLTILLDAYEALLGQAMELPDIVIAGRKGWMMENLLDGYSKKLRARVHLPGFIKDEDLRALYEKASYFVSTSKYEGFGIPPLEAMYYKTPVISSDIPAAREVLGNVPVYFEPNDSKSLEAAIIRMQQLVSDKESREKIVFAGHNRACRFSWDDSASRIIKNIEKLQG